MNKYVKKRKYKYYYEFTSNMLLLFGIAFLGYTTASFLFITFGAGKLFSWHNYWLSSEIILFILSGLLVIKMIFYKKLKRID